MLKHRPRVGEEEEEDLVEEGGQVGEEGVVEEEVAEEEVVVVEVEGVHPGLASWDLSKRSSCGRVS